MSRPGAGSAILTAILVVVAVGVIFLIGAPSPDQSDDAYRDFYGDGGNRIAFLIAAYLIGLAGIPFLVFRAHLSSALREAEGEPALFASVAGAAGLIWITLFLAAIAVFAAPAAAMQIDGMAQPDLELLRLMDWIAFGLFDLLGGFTGAAFIGATAIVVLRSEIAPRWVGWLGIVVAAAILVAIALFIPTQFVVMPVWLVVLSLTLQRQEAEARHVEEAAAKVGVG